jgi:hypothetical protein
MKYGDLRKKVRFYVKKGMSNADIAALHPQARPATLLEYARAWRKEFGLPSARTSRGPSIKLPNSTYERVKQEAAARGVAAPDLVRSLFTAIVAQNKFSDLLDKKGVCDA